MQNSNVLIAQALSTLKGNIERTGDPLGFTRPYWADWADGLDFPRQGNTILMTARMYQMLPFVMQTVALTSSIRPMLGLLSSTVCRKLADIGTRITGETVLRLKAGTAGNAKDIGGRGRRALRGIASAVHRAGAKPAYLHEQDPYSGVLLYDLGLENETVPHMRQVYRLLKENGARQVITTDPHTTFMLREVYPRHIPGFDLYVRHYLEIVAGQIGSVAAPGVNQLPASMVMHDSCVMTRDLGIIEQARQVAAALGITLLEPENTGQNTACCGGPVEYAYAALSAQISRIRIKELAAVSRDILVTCPICLLNLSKYERSDGVRIWDMGELLGAAGGTVS